MALAEPRTVGHRSNPWALGQTLGAVILRGGCPSRISSVNAAQIALVFVRFDHVAGNIVKPDDAP